MRARKVPAAGAAKRTQTTRQYDRKTDRWIYEKVLDGQTDTKMKKLNPYRFVHAVTLEKPR